MESSELRIGNFLYHEQKNKIVFAIIPISDITMLYLGNNYNKLCFYKEIFLDECLPIILTEDWLLKFGFEKYKIQQIGYDNNNGYKITINDFDFLLDFEFHYIIETNDYPAIASFKIKHVHQLQNIFYSLTQKELIYTPNETT